MEESREVTALKRKVANLQRAVEGKGKKFYKSKKFLSAFASVLFVAMADKLGIKESNIILMLSPVLAYIVGQGIADINQFKDR